MDMEKLKKAVTKGNIDWRKHGFRRMLERNINRDNVIKVLMEGQLIEEYKSDNPFPSA